MEAHYEMEAPESPQAKPKITMQQMIAKAKGRKGLLSSADDEYDYLKDRDEECEKSVRFEEQVET